MQNVHSYIHMYIHACIWIKNPCFLRRLTYKTLHGNRTQSKTNKNKIGIFSPYKRILDSNCQIIFMHLYAFCIESACSPKGTHFFHCPPPPHRLLQKQLIFVYCVFSLSFCSHMFLFVDLCLYLIALWNLTAVMFSLFDYNYYPM